MIFDGKSLFMRLRFHRARNAFEQHRSPCIIMLNVTQAKQCSHGIKKSSGGSGQW